MKVEDDPDNENAHPLPLSPAVLADQKNGPAIDKFSVFVVVAAIAILTFMLLPAVQQTRGPHRRPPCQNNCRQIALAMINYESGRGHFPPAYIADENGKPMHSWRVLLLPNLEQQDLYNRYRMDEPWDGPNNSKLHNEIVPQFRCPSSNSAAHCSDYALVTGKGTAFDPGKTINYGDILDGSSNTILIVENFAPDCHWMKPQDIPIDQFLDSTVQETANHPGTRNVGLFDGSTHSISTDTPKEELRKLVMIADGEVVDVLDFLGR